MSDDAEEERFFLGSAVENGKVRFASVSAIQTFDVETEGGCPRKWGFRYINKIKGSKTQSKVKGTESAKVLEHYLTTNEMNLPPMLVAGLKYLPKPGPDLEVERPFGDVAKFMPLRDAFLKTGVQTFNDDAVRLAGLSAGGIPLVGAADYRHRRGEFVNPDGILCKERPEHGRVTETGDHKTISKLDDVKKGNIITLKSHAKKSHELPENVQLLGYGKHENILHPETDTHRFSLNYYQSKGAKKARKVTTLVSAREVNERWARIDEIVAPEMIVSATAVKAEDLPPNANACDAFNFVTPEGLYRKGCMHQDYCTVNRTAIVLHRLGVAPEQTQGDSMSLFNMLAKPTAVEDAAVAPPPPAPPMSPSAYAAEVEAEKAKQRAEDAAPKAPVAARISCGAEGCGDGCAPGYVRSPDGGPNAYLICSSCKGAGGLGVLPPDAPVTTDLLKTAAPLPAGAIAEITDPAFRAKVEEHARAHGAVVAAEEQAKAAEKGSVWCSGGSQTAEPVRVEISIDAALERKVKCTACDKELTFKKAEKDEAGKHYVLFKRHKPVGQTAAPPAPVAPPPPPASDLPVYPRYEAPPPPYIAPDAIPGQTTMSVVAPPPPVFAPPPPPPVAPPPPSAFAPPPPPAPPTPFRSSKLDITDIGMSRLDFQQAVRLLGAAEETWGVDPVMAEPLVQRAVKMAMDAIARL